MSLYKYHNGEGLLTVVESSALVVLAAVPSLLRLASVGPLRVGILAAIVVLNIFHGPQSVDLNPYRSRRLKVRQLEVLEAVD